MKRLLLLTTLLVATAAAAADAGEPEGANGAERTFGNYALTGTASTSSTSTYSKGLSATALFIIPLIVLIILLDFAIFGAFANRSDELNPVSEFFWHVKRGMDVMRERNYREPYPSRRKRRKRRKNKDDSDDPHRNGDVYARNDYGDDDFLAYAEEPQDIPGDVWEELGLRPPPEAAALEAPRVAR